MKVNTKILSAPQQQKWYNSLHTRTNTKPRDEFYVTSTNTLKWELKLYNDSEVESLHITDQYRSVVPHFKMHAAFLVSANISFYSQTKLEIELLCLQVIVLEPKISYMHYCGETILVIGWFKYIQVNCATENLWK